MRRKHRAGAFGLAIALHLVLLLALPKSDGALGPLQAPIVVSLAEGPEGGLAAPALKPRPGKPGAQPTAPEVPSAAPAAAPALQSEPTEPAPERPEPVPSEVEPLPAPLEAAAPPPAPQTAPDLTADPVEPGAAVALLSQLEALLAGGASAQSVNSAVGQLSGSGDRCRLAEALQGMLQADAEVAAALARIPREARSVANAMMLWDGAWVQARATDGTDGLQPVREAIEHGVRTAPIACREQVISGPLFLAITAQPGTTLLALGSGSWRWSDLLRTAPAN